MQATALLATLATAATLIASPALAADHQRSQRQDRPHAAAARSADSTQQTMQQVAHSASASQPGHGWQYFSEPAARRAVVISPQGDYYLSQGKGLRWVAAEQKGV